MARKTRASKLETRTTRLRLEIRRKPYFVTVAPNIAVGYRRNIGAGTWSVRASDGHGSNWLKSFAVADDHEESNGESVLDFWAAQDRARAIARAGEGSGERPASVGEALESYEASLRARGGDLRNASRVRHNLPSSLAAKPVALLTPKELRHWRDGMVKAGMSAGGADRTARALKAALNAAAADDLRITNAATWRTGLKKLPDSETARNVILPDATVQAIVRASYQADRVLGVFIETLATVGARESQVLRLEVADLQDDPVAPRLMMPGSFKGKSRKVGRKPLAISPALAATLRQAAIGRASHDKLLDRIPRLDLRFRPIAEALGLDRSVTLYSLRHSSIVRMLLAGVPVRVTASHHDTSAQMIEANYSRFIIGDPSDALVRRTLLDMGTPAAGPNVVPLAGRKP